MLGTSAEKIQYRTLCDFHSPADYLDYMFGGVQGVAYRAIINPKYYQSYYRTSGLSKASYAGVDNCYVAMNTFYRTSDMDYQKGRDVDHIKRLNALYVDIDCYKLGLTKGEVLIRLTDDYIGSKIPVPTFIIDSGRGIYLIWKLRNEDKRALPRWTAVEQYLTDTLEGMGADQACTDASRVLRVPYSWNPKSKSAVSILAFNDLTYSIYEISKEYGIKTAANRNGETKTSRKKYPYNHATEKQRKYVRDLATRLGLSEEEYPDFTNFHDTDNWIKLHRAIERPQKTGKGYCYDKGNTYSLSEFKALRGVLGSYCADIRKLFSMRKGANCKREIGLFLYRYFLREMKYDSNTALKETLAFNAFLDCPFDEDYVITVTASADRRIAKGIPYAYKKSTIIKILDITKEEMAELPYLSSKTKSQKERRRESNRRAYESRLAAEGKVAKKDAILERRVSILAMQEQGKTAAEIMESLHISRATYNRDIAALSVESVLNAARAILTAQVENLADTTKKAAEAVSEAVKSVTEAAVTALAQTAVSMVKNKRNNAQNSLSHFFSRSIYRVYAVGVPHSPVRFRGLSKFRRWLAQVRAGRTSDDDGGGACG